MPDEYYTHQFSGEEIDAAVAAVRQSLETAAQKSSVMGLGNAIGMRGWNQLIQNGDFGSTDGWKIANDFTLTVENNVGTITATAQQTSTGLRILMQTAQSVVNHKYFLAFDFKADASLNGVFTCRMRYNTTDLNITPTADGTWHANAAVGTIATQAEIFLLTNSRPVPAGASAQLRNVVCIDLTALFGAGNEPSTVAEFRAMFPATYYPHCSGQWADLLWQNASPTTTFAAQTINLNSKGYGFVLVAFIRSGAAGTTYQSSIVAAKSGRQRASSNISGKIIYRDVSCSDTAVTFLGGSIISSYGSEAEDNDKMIPYRIYGIR